MAELMGGNFSEGVLYGAISGTVAFGFQEIYQDLKEYLENIKAEKEAVLGMLPKEYLRELMQARETAIPDPDKTLYQKILNTYRSYPGIEDTVR